MGVPAFFRWLCKRYPRVVTDAKEEEMQVVDGVGIPIDASQPNPNGVEFDCLYLDMNGIIHPCCHPEDKDAPPTEDAMIEAVFAYTDRIFRIVRPRHLLYMAIDGVAPRAKMNQQRSRRFRSAQEVRDNEMLEQELRAQLQAEGKRLPQKKPKAWDHNVITPGTPFMARLSEGLKHYVAQRLQSDPAWGNVHVIFSDALVPGEGEHKIMQYIRRQRASPGYNPNWKHCLYGMDADLIMLGLATHEAHFTIIRETIIESRKCFICGREGHFASDCQGVAAVDEAVSEKKDKGALRPYQFLHISVLRECLSLVFEPMQNKLPFAYDFERIIDDWIFICFFVGNDFLPHLPSLDIREGAIDKLQRVYMQHLPALGGYLTEEGRPNFTRVAVFLSHIGAMEDSIFKRRKRREIEKQQREDNQRKEREMRERHRLQEKREGKELAPMMLPLDGSGRKGAYMHPAREQLRGTVMTRTTSDSSIASLSSLSPTPSPNPPSNLEAAKNLKLLLKKKKGTKRKRPSEADQEGTEQLSRTKAEETDATGQEHAVSQAAATVVDVQPPKGPKEEEVKPLQTPTAPGDVTPSPNPNMADMDAAQTDGDAMDTSPATDNATVQPMDSEPQHEHTSHETVPVKKEGVSLSTQEPNRDILETDSTPPVTKRLKTDSDQKAVDVHNFKRLLKGRIREANTLTDPQDSIRLGEEGWKERYYRSKFHWDLTKPEDKAQLRRLCNSYAKGLCWVMEYYFRGVPSWSWYYENHYSPMVWKYCAQTVLTFPQASDLDKCDEEDLHSFDLNKPFSPIAQLMGVLPADSSHCLPPACQRLMKEDSSPIIDFYPTKFDLDLNGKKYAWQAVVLLPFIEEARLKTALQSVQDTFTEDEKQRDGVGHDYLFVNSYHNPLSSKLVAMHTRLTGPLADMKERDIMERTKLQLDIDSDQGVNIAGTVYLYPSALVPRSTAQPPMPCLQPIPKLQVLSCVFEDPPPRPHRSIILPGAVLPAPRLTDYDKAQIRQASLPPWQRGRQGTFHQDQLKWQQQRNQRHQYQQVMGGFNMYQPRPGGAPMPIPGHARPGQGPPGPGYAQGPGQRHRATPAQRVVSHALGGGRGHRAHPTWTSQGPHGGHGGPYRTAAPAAGFVRSLASQAPRMPPVPRMPSHPHGHNQHQSHPPPYGRNQQSGAPYGAYEPRYQGGGGRGRGRGRGRGGYQRRQY